MVASPGDYIILGVAGEFYPCKPGVFDATYEEIRMSIVSDDKQATELTCVDHIIMSAVKVLALLIVLAWLTEVI